MDYNEYIVRDPKICGGEPVIKGTRVTLRTVLASLADGDTIAEILDDFPLSPFGKVSKKDLTERITLKLKEEGNI